MAERLEHFKLKAARNMAHLPQQKQTHMHQSQSFFFYTITDSVFHFSAEDYVCLNPR